ncbi:MAG: AAA family ATPase [Phycisphaerales bacterium]|nr:AAA family ATPase [Phycisphaerales bacterium]
MRTIAIINQKGGSGKTTTAINLAAVLAKRGLRTLLVDLDPQSHCAIGLSVPENQIETTIADALLSSDARSPEAEKLIWQVNKTLHLIPSGTRLAGLEAPRGGLAEREDRDVRLAIVLSRFAGSYDWCLIDCSPSIGLLTYNALRAADEVLVPVQTGYFAMRGAEKQIAALEALGRRFGRAPAHRVLPTMHEPDSPLSSDILAEIETRFGRCLVPVTIRHDERLREAASMGVPVNEYAPRSRGSADYAALASCLTENFSSEGHLDRLQDELPRAGTAAAGPDGPIELLPFTSGDRPTVAGKSSPAPAETPASDFDTDHKPGFGSRAAELAARAKMLLLRGGDIQRRLAADPRVAKVMHALGVDQPDSRDQAPAVAAADTSSADLRVSAPAATTPLKPAEPGLTFTPLGVRFAVRAAVTSRVCIAGTHNGWQPDVTPLVFNHATGLHETVVPMPTGRTLYRLVIDGQWCADPANPFSEPNPFGELNSVLDVPVADPRRIAPATSRPVVTVISKVHDGSVRAAG